MRWYFWLALLIPLTLLLWIFICLAGVLPQSTTEQWAALAVLKQHGPDPNDDSNAYPSLWLIQYDIPLSERRGITQKDVERANGLVSSEESLKNLRPSVAANLTAESVTTADLEILCSRKESSCLAKIRKAPEAVRKIIDSHAGLLQRTRELARFSQIRDPLPKSFESPLPSTGSAELVLSNAAMQFIDGDTRAGFSEVCEFANTWRRLRAHTDMLISDLIGISRVTESARVFSQMLNEVPSNYILPETCASTFTPLLDDEFDQCDEMRNEFKSIETVFSDEHDSFGSHPPKVSAPVIERLMMNREHARLIATVHYARLCNMEHKRKVSARAPEPPFSPPHCSYAEWPFDMVGCYLVENSFDYSDYYTRILDLDANLRGVSTALWLRQQTGDRKTAFSARPETLRDQHHEMELTPDGMSIRVLHLATKGTYVGWWEIPLPPTKK
ncbi:hypothetical protein ELE36_07360 [Pseudolysobacter antarcticus]|uniref:Uncharacterized protein n=1 Tax=Pseudolysobacter antarcticus TaxID=2511995 RepID=A0A411HI57_9GAMM|nr:hypothetical protein [Pseudolysobacter antarcticus]QBB70195.1 hypothetical protein ELE36_07360 [Pseudolysobacter antarcticus]